nr:PREDICTED: GTPase IMAP family member 7-like [Lepisosteus oculatus]
MGSLFSKEEPPQEPLPERRIVVIGRTGVGKSAVCNTILGREEFKSLLCSASVTKHCEKHHTEVDGRPIDVIDTPGLLDTRHSDEETIKEIVKCIQLSCPGPHAFLLVTQWGRFTPEEQNSVEALQKLFGEKAKKFIIFLFTRGDDLKHQTINNYVEMADGELRRVIRKCESRFHIFNNNEKKDRTQVRKLLDMIDSMVAVNGGGHYTQQMYEEAERKIRQKEEELRRKETEEQRRREEEVAKSLEKAKNRLEKDLQSFEENILKKYQEKLRKIRKEDKNSSYDFDFMEDLTSGFAEFKNILEDS